MFVFLVAGEAKDVPEDPRLRIVTGDITDASECEKLIDEATAATAVQHADKDGGQWELHKLCVLFSAYVYNYVLQRERESPSTWKKGHAFAHICTYLHMIAHICTMFGSGVS